MASFSISTPRSLNDSEIIIQDTSPDFSHPSKTFTAISPSTYSFTATSTINTFSHIASSGIIFAEPIKMTNIVIRPSVGQVYPRTI